MDMKKPSCLATSAKNGSCGGLRWDVLAFCILMKYGSIKTVFLMIIIFIILEPGSVSLCIIIEDSLDRVIIELCLLFCLGKFLVMGSHQAPG